MAVQRFPKPAKLSNCVKAKHLNHLVVVDKTGVPATRIIYLNPLRLAAFGEMSQIVLVTGTPVLSTILYPLKIYHFLSHLVQSAATGLIWHIPPLEFGEMSQIVLLTGTPVLSTTIPTIQIGPLPLTNSGK